MQKASILIVGVGNELKQDDAFGIEFIRQFEQQEHIPEQVKLMEVGIGGIHLVQELHYGYDILIMADAVEWGDEAGQVFFRKVEHIGNIEEMQTFDKRTFLADMHYTNPMRALMLAKALQVLPGKVYILGCKAAQHNDFAIGMSEVVEAAIPKAVIKLNEWLAGEQVIKVNSKT